MYKTEKINLGDIFMAKYDWKVEPRDEDWSDDTYAYFLIHINLPFKLRLPKSLII